MKYLISALIATSALAYDVDTVSTERSKEITTRDPSGKTVKEHSYYKDIEREEALIHSDDDMSKKKNKSSTDEDDDGEEEDD